MRIGFTGSWKANDKQHWPLRSSRDVFENACREIGREFAKTRTPILVGSDRITTADKFVVDGYLEAGPPSDGSIGIVRPRQGGEHEPAPFADLYARFPKAFDYDFGEEDGWRHNRHRFVRAASCIVTIGGNEGTYQVGVEARLAGKRLIPIGSFGGASERLADLATSHSESIAKGLRRLADNPWLLALAQEVVDLTRAAEPIRVLIIHGHAEDHGPLTEWLRGQGLAEPVVMKDETATGRVLAEKFESLASDVDAAIALVTPDDQAFANKAPADIQLHARQNVWLEVGWFWGHLGRDRVLLLVRDKVEFPSDLLGIEYVKYSKLPQEQEGHIRNFIGRVRRGS